MSCLSSPSSKSNNFRKESRRRRIQDRDPCLSSSRHWEVELWRRNQGITSAHSEVISSACIVDSLATDIISQPLIPPSSHYSDTSPCSPTLPSNPAAFDLNPPSLSLESHGRPSTLYPRHADNRPGPACSHDLDQLRLDALTELQRSVVETGEGFVDKMRDWETHRQREAMSRRGLKRSRSMMTRRTSGLIDDSDDVMILDSAPAHEEVHSREPPQKKRALSVCIVDALDAAVPSEVTPPTMTDDDTESCSRDSISAEPSDAPPHPDAPSFYSDKAVSALTLAFANGACGINDYQAVLDAYNYSHYGEESQVGELWD